MMCVFVWRMSAGSREFANLLPTLRELSRVNGPFDSATYSEVVRATNRSTNSNTAGWAGLMK
jgi:hypothetical protein